MMNTQRLRSLLQRRNILPLTIALLSSLIILYGLASGAAQTPEKEEREVEDKIPKHLAIKVKIKKPEKLKDAKNEDWPDDVEIEVTNTGTKPIYFLSIHLALPDVLAENGNHYVFLYHYGFVKWLKKRAPEPTIEAAGAARAPRDLNAQRRARMGHPS
jgi:hypothetical protein